MTTVHLHLVKWDDGTLALRAALKIEESKHRPGYVGIVEYDNGHQFEVHKNKRSISVWRIPDA